MSTPYYASLLSYSNRIDLFRRAIEVAVRPGDRVLDVGTGLGTFGFFAAQSGAERVVAVDSSPVVHLAETLASANGLADRIEFVRGSLPGAPIQGEFDVIIFEDFPTPFLDHSTFGLLKTLQEEHLAPGGRVLPRSARMCLAPVQSHSVWNETFPLDAQGHERWDLDWTGIRPFLANTPRQLSLRPEDIQGEVVFGPSLPLQPVPTAPELRVEGSWDGGEPGVVHGLALWFDLEIHAGGWISNGPRPDTEPWGQWFLPVDRPLEVGAGQTLQASVWREALEHGAPGWTGWECRVEGEVRKGHEFAGMVVGVQDLTDPVTDPVTERGSGDTP